ncbi:hypothetical protein M427DRAFT_27691 [Gonapodya prolifera JEL478]|uniref:AB hydrolase-1 domain-containing protein n=1 Tax=Gonapodya prolifera (strain JEL478) TaxID=1344416 RepID=A0A139AX53_GONPJ|nr:hypothetical protein M427DRAFT_27691 [Gonapodya prolifera JEL478]|eukprot:KXS21279.1 hypothetical protein M427DRAFT_27691 [Gonapodya prolifera JEL478]
MRVGGIITALLALAPLVASAPLTRRHYQEVIDGYEIGADIWKRHTAVNVTAAEFYKTPANFTKSSKPGDLLKFEQISRAPLDLQYAIPPSLTLYRMMYVSVDINNLTVPATGFILLPFTPAAKGLKNSSAYPTLVWTHGTAGVTRDCAPTLLRGLYYDFEGPFEFALEGYAVVAPDYAGLGSDTRFDYVAGPPHADDASYSVVAARKSPIAHLLTYEWAVIGHSEGGMAAWFTNEAEHVRPVGGFIGSVSVAPALFTSAYNGSLDYTRPNVSDGIAPVVPASDPPPNIDPPPAPLDTGLYYLMFSIQSAARLNKSIIPENYLTEKGKVAYHLLEQGGCYIAGQYTTSNMTFEDLFTSNDAIEALRGPWLARIQPGGGARKLGGPMLVIQSIDDEAVSFPAVLSAFRGNCQAQPENQIGLHLYSELTHDGTMFGSKYDYVNFLDALFNNHTAAFPVAGKCEETFIPSGTTSFKTYFSYELN